MKNDLTNCYKISESVQQQLGKECPKPIGCELKGFTFPDGCGLDLNCEQSTATRINLSEETLTKFPPESHYLYENYEINHRATLQSMGLGGDALDWQDTTFPWKFSV
eukprot:UN32307